jgi:hypothetical protein
MLIQDFDPAESSRETYRASQVAELPVPYRPKLRFTIQVLVVLASVITPIVLVEDPTAGEYAAIPIAFLVANLFEWWVHRYPMHRPWLKFIYEPHTKRHHRIYRHYDMAMRGWGEISFVSFGLSLFIGIIASTLFFATIVWLLAGWNMAMIFLATALAYILIYDLLHLSYHLPADHPIAKLGPIHWLGNWHRRHHDPKLMRNYNFNVTLPLADWLFRTVAPKDAVEADQADVATRR